METFCKFDVDAAGSRSTSSRGWSTASARRDERYPPRRDLRERRGRGGRRRRRRRHNRRPARVRREHGALSCPLAYPVHCRDHWQVDADAAGRRDQPPPPWASARSGVEKPYASRGAALGSAFRRLSAATAALAGSFAVTMTWQPGVLGVRDLGAADDQRRTLQPVTCARALIAAESRTRQPTTCWTPRPPACARKPLESRSSCFTPAQTASAPWTANRARRSPTPRDTPTPRRPSARTRDSNTARRRARRVVSPIRKPLSRATLERRFDERAARPGVARPEREPEDSETIAGNRRGSTLRSPRGSNLDSAARRRGDHADPL